MHCFCSKIWFYYAGLEGLGGNDGCLQVTSDLHRLECLGIYFWDITDMGLQYISRLKHLKYFELYDDEVTDRLTEKRYKMLG